MKQQKGATLLVVLIMLVLMTLAAGMSFNSGRIFSAIVGNQQAVQTNTAVAEAALEEVMSRTFFADSPTVPFGTSNQVSYDTNSDNVTDVTVTVASCMKSFTPATLPDPTVELGCISGEEQTKGIEGAGTTQACAEVIWELTATALDNVTEAKSVVVQGVRILQPVSSTTNAANYCQ